MNRWNATALDDLGDEGQAPFTREDAADGAAGGAADGAAGGA